MLAEFAPKRLAQIALMALVGCLAVPLPFVGVSLILLLPTSLLAGSLAGDGEVPGQMLAKARDTMLGIIGTTAIRLYGEGLIVRAVFIVLYGLFVISSIGRHLPRPSAAGTRANAVPPLDTLACCPPHMKSPLRVPSGVTNAHDTFRYRCALRLAVSANPAISLRAVIHEAAHQEPAA